MRDGEPPDRNAAAAAGAGDPPRRTRLGRILDEHPEARPRLSDAVGSLLKVVLASLVVVVLLAIWHLRRRAQIIRDRLGPELDVSLPDYGPAHRDDPIKPPGEPGA